MCIVRETVEAQRSPVGNLITFLPKCFEVFTFPVRPQTEPRFCQYPDGGVSAHSTGGKFQRFKAHDPAGFEPKPRGTTIRVRGLVTGAARALTARKGSWLLWKSASPKLQRALAQSLVVNVEEERIDPMLWTFAAVGATGVLLGLWFRVAALAAASGVTAIACLPVAVLAGVGLMPSLIITFAAVGLLQAGYLAGVMSACAQSRGDAPSGRRPQVH